MTPTPRALVALPLLLSLACSGYSTAESDATTSPTTSASTTNAATSATDGEADTGGGSHEICDRYIACVAVTNPMGLPAAQEGFGSDSECWMMSQEQIDLCLQACEAGIVQSHAVYPDEPKCYLCNDDSECEQAAGETCFKGTCGTLFCGDGVVQEGEICDGQETCPDDCYGGAACSPLTNAGCTIGWVCLLAFGQNKDTLDSNCGPVGELCGDSDNSTHCGPGTYCKYELGPEMLTCQPYCDVNAPNTCPPGESCVPMKDVPGSGEVSEPALAYVGHCR